MIHGNLSVNTEKSDTREFLVTANLRILQKVFLKKMVLFLIMVLVMPPIYLSSFNKSL